MTAPSLHDRYESLRPLAKGGMAVVYLAREVETGRTVALKQLALPEGARLSEWRLRFQQEFHTAARLRHPNIVATYDYAVAHDGVPFFTMEYLPGPGLEEIIPIAPERLLTLLPGLLRGLAYLHLQGFIHADLKPENLRIGEDGEVRLMDLGLVTRVGQPSAGLQGTMPYVAPEVIRQAPADRRNDLYALGAVLYHLLTGEPPFTGDPRTVLLGHIEREPVPLRTTRPEIPEQLARLVHKLLAKDPLQRFQSAGEALRFLGEGGGTGPLERDQTLFHPPLVGRQSELKSLSEALGRAREEYQEVYLFGDADVGLAPVLDEFCARAQLQGATVLRAAFRPRMAPFEGLRSISRGLYAMARHAESLDHLHPVLAHILPELGTAAQMDGADPHQERLRLLDALTQLMRRASQSEPVVLAFADAHHGDPGWREWLDHLRRTAATLPVLIVATMVGAPDLDLELCRTELELGPLSLSECHETCQAILGQAELDADFTARVHAATGGYPARVEALLQRLADSDRIFRASGAWVLTKEPLDGILDASEAHWALEQSLKGLSPLALRLLDVLALRNRETPLFLLWRMVGESESTEATGALFEAIASLEAGGWIRSGQEHVVFSPDRDREALLGRLEPAERAARHRAIVQGLASALADAPGDLALLSELAVHSLLGGDPAGPRHALDAARQHARLFGLEEAESLLREAIQALEAQSVPDGRTLLAMLALRADVARWAGDRRLAEQCYARAIALAQGANDAETLAAVSNGYGRLKVAAGELDAAQGLFEQALSRLGAETIHREVALALTHLGRLGLTRGDLKAAKRRVEQALTLARAGGFRALVRDNMAQLGYLYVAAGENQAAEGLGLLFEALQMTEQDEAKLELNASYALLGNAQLLLGRFGEAREAFQRNCDLCAEIGAAPHDEAMAFMRLTQVELELGDYRAARKAAGPAGALARMVGNKLLLAQVRLLEGMAALYQSDFTIYQEAATFAEEILKGADAPAAVAMYQACRAEAEGFFGQWSNALSAAGQALELAADGAGHEWAERAAILKGEALTRLGLFKPARQALDAAPIPRSEALHARLLLVRAHLERLDGQPSQAQSLARRALDLSHRAGVVPVSAACCLLLAQSATRREEALAWARKALLDAEALGQPVLEAEAYYQASRCASRNAQSEWYLQAAEEAYRRAIAALSPAAVAPFGATPERKPLADLIQQRLHEGYRVSAEDQEALLALLALPPEPETFLPAVVAFCQSARAERVAIVWENAEGVPTLAHAQGKVLGAASDTMGELEAARQAAQQGLGVVLIPLSAGREGAPWGALLVAGLTLEARERLEKLLPALGGALWAARRLALADSLVLGVSRAV